jgi:hypothetical protein
VTRWASRARSVALGLAVVVGSGAIPGSSCLAQDDLVERPGPPPTDELEADLNHDGIPDGWYNALDIKRMAEGGVVGPQFVRFECSQRGRPARLSRAFGIDGRKVGAVQLGLWVRLNNIQYGEREGDEPQLMIDFLGDQLRQLGRGTLGPWTHTVHDRWTRVVKRIPVPRGTKDAIMSVAWMVSPSI